MSAPVDTFDVRLELGHAVDRDRRSVVTPPGRAPFLRRQALSGTSEWTGKRERRSWSLQWAHGRKQEAVRLRELRAICRSGARNLYWTPPGEGSPIVVRMLPREFSIEQATPELYRMSCQLEEVL